MRLGLYSPIKTALSTLGGTAAGSCGRSAATAATAAVATASRPELSFMGKLLAGSLSGGLAAAVTNPTELVKVREAVAASQEP